MITAEEARVKLQKRRNEVEIQCQVNEVIKALDSIIEEVVADTINNNYSRVIFKVVVPLELKEAYNKALQVVLKELSSKGYMFRGNKDETDSYLVTTIDLTFSDRWSDEHYLPADVYCIEEKEED